MAIKPNGDFSLFLCLRNIRIYIIWAVKNATKPSVKKYSDWTTNSSKTSPNKENTKAKSVRVLIGLESDAEVFINKKIRLITIAGFAMKCTFCENAVLADRSSIKTMTKNRMLNCFSVLVNIFWKFDQIYSIRHGIITIR